MGLRERHAERVLPADPSRCQYWCLPPIPSAPAAVKRPYPASLVVVALLPPTPRVHGFERITRTLESTRYSLAACQLGDQLSG